MPNSQPKQSPKKSSPVVPSLICYLESPGRSIDRGYRGIRWALDLFTLGSWTLSKASKSLIPSLSIWESSIMVSLVWRRVSRYSLCSSISSLVLEFINSLYLIRWVISAWEWKLLWRCSLISSRMSSLSCSAELSWLSLEGARGRAADEAIAWMKGFLGKSKLLRTYSS